MGIENQSENQKNQLALARVRRNYFLARLEALEDDLYNLCDLVRHRDDLLSTGDCERLMRAYSIIHDVSHFPEPVEV